MHKSYAVSCEDGFGPRPRSDEHIIPKMVFGNLITTDLCRCCNSHFGEVCDHALANDQRIVEAAQRVGLSASDLWSRFEGVQHTVDGRPIKTAFKDGVFQPQAALSSLDALAIPATNGQISKRHLIHLRAQLIKKARRKPLGLSEQQIEAEVDSLLNGLRASPSEEHHNPVIGERFQAQPLDSRVVVKKETRPWETDWCLAKIVFELSHTVVSDAYRGYFKEVLQRIRSFLERRECSADGQQGVGIFAYTNLPAERAAKCHTIEGRVSPRIFEWHLTFFGTARWSFHAKAEPIRAPAIGQLIKIENPTDGRDASISVQETHDNPT